MNKAIQKRLELLLSWQDKGFERGYKRAQKGMAAVKKSIMSIVKAAALIAGAFVGATMALLKFIKLGAEVKSVGDSFYGFVDSANMSKETLQDLREAVRGTIDDVKLMQSSITALSGGMDPRTLLQYWEMAKQIADVSSRDTVEVFNSLALALNKVEVQTLETIGITIKMSDVMRTYARETGKSVGQMTLMDRKIAFSRALLEKYERDFYSVGDVTTRVREKFQQFMTTIINLKNSFFEMVASSPAAMKFLDLLKGRIQGLMDSLDEEKIDRFVTKFVGIFDRLDEYLDKIVEWKKNVSEFIETFEAPLIGIGAGLFTAKLGSVLAPILTAFGVSGPLAAGLVGIAALFVALGVTAVQAFKNMQDAAEETARLLAEEYPFGGMNPQDYQNQMAMLEALKGKKQEVEEARVPGGLVPREIKWEEEIAAERIGPNKFELLADLQAAANARELETYEAHTALLIDLDEYRARRSMEIGTAEHMRSVREFRLREEAIRRGYWAMGEYQALFFRHGGKMGRAFNAMMLRGVTETVASYIEMKTEQARVDAMMFAAYAIGALASGQWGRAAAYGSAAARLGAIAGVAAIAAGAIREYGAERAESMTREAESYEAGAFADTEEPRGTRRSASGVVNGRPVIINIMSKVEIRSGVTIFGDSEDGLEEFYGEHIRDYIQDDVETGIISIPA